MGPDVSVVFDYSPIWPDPTTLKPQAELCIIVVPHSYDRSAAIVAGVDSAASEVFVGNGPAAESFKFIERICEIEKLRTDGKTAKFREGLKAAIADKDKRIRSYAIDALFGEFMGSEPEQVMDTFRQASLRQGIWT